MADMARQRLLKILAPFPLSPNLTRPTIPAKAGIQEALIWIPAFAGMAGAGRMVKG